MANQAYMKNFVKYSSLSVFGTLGVSCYILADTFFVSKGLGAEGLAALNIAVPAYNFIHGSGLMFGMGGATKFTISKSEGNERQANIIFTNTVYLALLAGILFLGIGLLFSQPLSKLLGADDSILAMTNTYLKWLFLFAPAFILNDVLLCFVRNDNAPMLSTAAMLLGSFSNIVLDYIFIFPMEMGMFGAIFATGLSPVISLLIMSLHWIGKKGQIHLIKTRLYGKIMIQDISLGFPSLIAQMASGIAMIIFNMLILELTGNTGVAAYSVIANISLVIVAVYTGISQGVQPLISEAYGKDDKNEISLGLRYSMVTMAVLSFLFYFIIFAFAGNITGIFNSENNPYMQEISVTGLKIYFSSVLFVGFNTIIAVFFTSIEKALPAQILSLLRGILLLVPLAFLCSKLWGMIGIWITYPLTEGIAAAAGYVIYKYYARKGAEL